MHMCAHSMKPFQVVNAESQLESRQQFHENWGINIIQNLLWQKYVCSQDELYGGYILNANRLLNTPKKSRNY